MELNITASEARKPKDAEAVAKAVQEYLEFARTQVQTGVAVNDADTSLRATLIREDVLTSADMPLGVQILPPVEGDTAVRLVLTGLAGDIMVDVTDQGAVHVFS